MTKHNDYDRQKDKLVCYISSTNCGHLLCLTRNIRLHNFIDFVIALVCLNLLLQSGFVSQNFFFFFFPIRLHFGFLEFLFTIFKLFDLWISLLFFYVQYNYIFIQLLMVHKIVNELIVYTCDDWRYVKNKRWEHRWGYYFIFMKNGVFDVNSSTSHHVI